MVAVLNSSTVVSDAEVDRLVDATNWWMAHHVAPALGKLPWTFHRGGRAYIHSLIVDTDAGVPGALAYHSLGQDGHPVMVTMAKTILDYGSTLFGPDGVFSAHGHEVVETYVDPYCNDISQGPDGRYYWHEFCDAVQGLDYDLGGSYPGVYATDFCLPHWFNPDSPDDKVDFVGGLSRPFQVAPQGYQVVSTCSGETQIGGTAVLEDFAGNQVPGGPNAWRTLKLTGVT